jgi:two-component system, OmpR family, sensor histidine kinase MtrB
MTLRTLLHGSALLLATAGLVATLSLAVFTDSLERAAAEMAHAVESINASERLASYLLLLNSERYYALLAGGELRAAGRMAVKQVEQSLRDIELFIASDEERRLVEDVQRHIEAFDAQWEDALRAGLPPADLYLAVTGAVERAYERLDALVELNLQQARTEQRAIGARNRFANLLAVGTAALLFGVAVAFLIGLRTFVYRPLASLVARIGSLRAAEARLAVDPRWPEEIREIAGSLEEMSEALKAQEQQRLQFLGGVAHDLRSPLNAMTLAVDLLANPRLDPEQRTKRIGALKRQLRHLARMLQDLLDTTQIEAGKLSLSTDEVDLAELLAENVELFRSPGEEDRFSVLTPAHACIARCDRTRMTQVVHNLLSNAVKYSPGGGAITVELRDAGECVELRVVDRGIGIDPAEHEAIFEPYRRTAGTRASFPGVGLGLSVARKIVHAHGGSVQVASAPGKGATFTVRLPKQRIE